MNCYRLDWVAKQNNVVARRLYDALATCEHVPYRIAFKVWIVYLWHGIRVALIKTSNPEDRLPPMTFGSVLSLAGLFHSTP